MGLKHRFIFQIFFLLCATVPAFSGTLHIIPVQGPVEPGMVAFIKRSIDDSLAQDPHGIMVFKLDTFGGRIDSALDIVEAISKLPREQSIAYVEKKAISAGALIALSCGKLIMADHTLIGDCAPIIQTREGQVEVGEKTQTVLRAKFRSLAKKNNYPPVLAEAMVSKNMEVYRVTLDGATTYMDKNAWEDLSFQEKKRATEKITIVPQGELLTMDDREALDLGFSQKSVKDIDQALAFLGHQNLQKFSRSESWSEALVRALQPFLPLLMLLGMGAVYTEVKAPGFGIPGVVGILCLGLVFFNQYLAGLAQATELLLLVTGCLLIFTEIFVIPGFGVAGVLGIIVIAMGLILSFQDFVLPNPEFPWEIQLMEKNALMVLGVFLGGIALAFAFIRYGLPRISRVMPGPYLSATLGSARVETDALASIHAGDKGKALTPLRPSGKIQIQDQKFDATTRGDFIPPKTPIQVEAIQHNRVIVRAIK